jgi:hypothetical protein
VLTGGALPPPVAKTQFGKKFSRGGGVSTQASIRAKIQREDEEIMAIIEIIGELLIWVR